MNTIRLVRHSMRAITRYKLRSAFIMLGSFIGATALTLVISVGGGAQRKMLATVRQLFGASSIMVMAGGTQLMSGPNANAARLTIDDIEAVATELPGIEAWDPLQAMPEASVRQGAATATARVLGESERSEHVWQRTVTRGEYFDAGAVRSSARVALIGETTAKELFGSEDPVGGDIEIGNVPFRVVGVLEPFGTDVHGMDRDDEIVVPISTMMRRVMNVDTITMAKLLVRDSSQVASAGREVTRVLRERHRIPSGRPDDFTLVTAVTVQTIVARMQKIFSLYLPLVAGISLIVAAIVAATLMLASVNERVAEIGLRRAIGARVEDIQLQFLVETTATIVGGGVAGTVVGSILAQIAANRLHLGTVLSWRAVTLAIIVSIVTGVLAGVVPARRAARLNPTEALR
jgi:putative ABC transport system permease protein